MTSSTHRAGWHLLCCVRDGLLNANRDEVQRAYVAAGQVAWDDCCGMLVVAPERIFRSVEFPIEAQDRELCYGGSLVAQFVILLVRCVPTVDEMGRAPTSERLDAAYQSLLEDAAVVWNSVVCCDLPSEWERAAVSQTFLGADGGCVGVETRVMIGFDQEKWAA